MDWHHPDGERSSTDAEAHKRFIDYTHGLIREILTNYGKIDILWYDGGQTLDANGWEAERMNGDGQRRASARHHRQRTQSRTRRLLHSRTKHHRRSQRSGLGELHDPQRKLGLRSRRRRVEIATHSPAHTLITCARDQGNFLINVGPKGDASPSPGVGPTHPHRSRRLAQAQWRIHLQHRPLPTLAAFICHVCAARLDTLYMHVHFWPGSDVSLSGLQTKVKSVRLLASSASLPFTQDDWRLHITGLPAEAPDHPITTLAIECESEPRMNTDHELRLAKPRGGVNMAG